MRRLVKYLVLVFSISILVVVGFYSYAKIYADKSPLSEEFKTPEEEDVLVRFGMEVYDIIADNYWQKAEEADLAEHFRISLVNVSNSAGEFLPTKDRAGTAKMLSNAVKNTIGQEAKKNLVLQISAVALNNLAPQGRNSLFSEEQERELRDTVANINRSEDLYEPLALEKGATPEQIETAYADRRDELLKDESEEAEKKIEELDYAYSVLSDTGSKNIYDQTMMKPTVSVRKIEPDILYADMRQFSPASFQEFAMALEKAGTEIDFERMIIDLRGNIGGSLDFVQYFMGFFFGPNQYVFDIFRRGDYLPQRTPNVELLDYLKKVKETAVLTDNMTQSSAELTAAVFKRFQLGVVIGEPTRGWGTIENTYPISTEIDSGLKYSVFLVNGLTLREDNQPIEGRGVDPDIDLRNEGWKQVILREFQSTDFGRKVIAEISKQAL